MGEIRRPTFDQSYSKCWHSLLQKDLQAVGLEGPSLKQNDVIESKVAITSFDIMDPSKTTPKDWNLNWELSSRKMETN